MTKVVTRKEVALHNKPDDCWIIIGDNVYDVTKFAPIHPGGELLLLQYGGTDVTEDFFGLHTYAVINKYHSRLLVATLSSSNSHSTSTSKTSLLSKVPFAEPFYFRGFHSKYYNDTHKQYRLALRQFITNEVKEYAEELEQSTLPISTPQQLEEFQQFKIKVGTFGLLAASIGPGAHLDLIPGPMPANVPKKDFDHFHELITHEEVARLLCPGFQDGIVGARNIAVPPLLKFPTKSSLSLDVARKSLSGEATACLAITEPFAGSDVASIRTTATKSPCGKFYIVNGVKKWITEGLTAQYFITAVLTNSNPDNKGSRSNMSLLLIERSEGLTTKRIKTSYSSAAGTSYVTFENVKVPVENLMGEENEGFKSIMYNFNHERWYIVVVLLAKCRFILEQCFSWSNQRKVFGKTLISQPVIQDKLAKMAARLESCYSWLEVITHQMNEMGFDEYNKRIGGDIALLKYEAANVAEMIASESVQIFGGRALTSSGMGVYIERFQRTYKFASIYGGASEIMASLGVRQAVRNFPKDSKL